MVVAGRRPFGQFLWIPAIAQWGGQTDNVSLSLKTDQLQPDSAFTRAVQVDDHHALPLTEHELAVAPGEAKRRGTGNWGRGTMVPPQPLFGTHTVSALLSGSVRGPEQASGYPERWVAARAAGRSGILTPPPHTGIVSLLPSSMAARWLCALIGSWSRQRCNSAGLSTFHPFSRHRCFSSCRGGAGLRRGAAARGCDAALGATKRAARATG